MEEYEAVTDDLAQARSLLKQARDGVEILPGQQEVWLTLCLAIRNADTAISQLCDKQAERVA